MTLYEDYKGKLIKMSLSYPIYDGDDNIIGQTSIGDLAVVTYSNIENNYHEVIIVSGEYIGIDTLALDNDNLKKCIFIFNDRDKDNIVYVGKHKLKCEWR